MARPQTAEVICQISAWNRLRIEPAAIYVGVKQLTGKVTSFSIILPCHRTHEWVCVNCYCCDVLSNLIRLQLPFASLRSYLNWGRGGGGCGGGGGAVGHCFHVRPSDTFWSFRGYLTSTAYWPFLFVLLYGKPNAQLIRKKGLSERERKKQQKTKKKTKKKRFMDFINQIFFPENMLFSVINQGFLYSRFYR